MSKKIKDILLECKNDLLNKGMFSDEQLAKIVDEKRKKSIMEKFKPYINKSTEEFVVKVIEALCKERLNLKTGREIKVVYNEYYIIQYFKLKEDLIRKYYSDVLNIISNNPEWNMDSFSQDQCYALAHYLDYDKYSCMTFDNEKYYLVDSKLLFNMLQPIFPSIYSCYCEGHLRRRTTYSTSFDDLLLHLEDDKIEENKSRYKRLIFAKKRQ